MITIRGIFLGVVLSIAMQAVAQTATLAKGKGAAYEPDVVVNSFTLQYDTSKALAIDFDCTNTGVRPIVNITAEAKSSDGEYRTYSNLPSIVPVGRHVHALVHIGRPEISTPAHTDSIVVQMYEPRQATFVYKTFPLPHDWPPESDTPPLAAEKDWRVPNATDYTGHLTSALLESDYALLDWAFAKWSNGGQRDDDGRWKLAHFVDAGKIMEKSATSEALRIQMQKWRRQNSKSLARAIIEASIWLESAKRLLEPDSGVWDVSAARQLAMVRFHKAETTLKEMTKEGVNSPAWFELRVSVAAAIGCSEREIESIFQAGTKKFPKYVPLYSAMIGHYAPGHEKPKNWDKVDQLVSQAVGTTQSEDGAANYAALYATVIYRQHIEFMPFSEETHLTWPKLRQGYQDMIQRFPSVNNLNEFAAFACRVDDSETFKAVWGQLRNRVVAEEWFNNFSVDRCVHRFIESS